MSDCSLGYVPRPWQRQVHIGLNARRWGVIVCHRRAGKTILAVMHLIDRACRSDRADYRAAYIAPLLKQSKAIAWDYLKRYACRIPDTRVLEAELRIILRNGAELRLYGADNPDALRGIYLDDVVLDEVSNLSKDLWDSVLRPALADRHGGALLMGTPSGVNLLSQVYYSATGDPSWYSACFTVDQTDALPKSEIEALRREMTETSFAREMLCDFSAAADNALLSVNQVEASTKRNPAASLYDLAPKILGVDVARQGDDRSVIFKRQGIASFRPEVFRGLDAMQVAAQVAATATEWQPDAIFIDGSGGYGAGVIDRLKQLRHRCVEVQFGGKADDPRFANKRAEIWFKMADWVKEAGAIPNDQDLKQDLCAPTYGHDIQGRMILESKDKIKLRGLPSPDLGDALALTFAHPVGIRTLDQAMTSPRKKYDPLSSVRK